MWGLRAYEGYGETSELYRCLSLLVEELPHIAIEQVGPRCRHVPQLSGR